MAKVIFNRILPIINIEVYYEQLATNYTGSFALRQLS